MIFFRFQVNTDQRVMRCCQFFAFALFALALSTANASKPTLIRHYDKGYSPLLRVYLTDVLTTALNKTVPEYGPFKIEFYSQNLSSNRSKVETERGALLDILFSTHWRGKFVNQGNVIQIEYPIFDGMLGLRSLIVSQERNHLFSKLRTTSELLQYSAGQGSSWTDTDILKANEISVIEAQVFDGLFPMLSKHRYDYLPLSILEAQTALQTKGLRYDNLMINEDVYLFYPMQFFLYVNANKPNLAKRLEKGLHIAQQDGSIRRLFEQHFYYVRPTLENKPKKLVVLQNPFVSPEESDAMVAALLDSFPHTLEVLPQ